MPNDTADFLDLAADNHDRLTALRLLDLAAEAVAVYSRTHDDRDATDARALLSAAARAWPVDGDALDARCEVAAIHYALTGELAALSCEFGQVA